MSLRARRALVGLVAAVAALAALPASALAAGETFTVIPANLQAGGTTNVTATMGFDTSESVKTVVASLAPGVLGNLNANAGCLVSQQLTSSCAVGTATIGTSGAPVPQGTLYLVPGQNGDAGGIEFVPGAGSPPHVVNQYIGVTLNPKAPGGLNLTTTFPDLTPSNNITSFTANLTTLNGQEFTRLPSSCGAATSTFSATYVSGATGSASGSFTPSGCQNLSYGPSVSATETKDAKDSGATLLFGVTQGASDAATKSISLKLPSGLGINLSADIPCITGTGCTVGTASATSPLVPNVALANGKVVLGGSASAPTITISFPAPFAITLVGNVSVANGTVTFANMPDVPLSSLNLNLTGPNGQKAFTTKCQASTTTGTFTSWSGASKTVSSTVKLVNCGPTATGALSGLASGHPGLKLNLTHGAANLASVSIGLPGGLKFSRAGIVTKKTCTTKGGKKKCTTTTLTKGLGIKGATAKSVALKRGRLLITFKKAAGKVTISVSGPVLTESKSLQSRVKKHKVKSLTVTLKITDAKKTSTLVPLKLKAH